VTTKLIKHILVKKENFVFCLPIETLENALFFSPVFMSLNTLLFLLSIKFVDWSLVKFQGHKFAQTSSLQIANSSYVVFSKLNK
jgi:hypothetical protein